MNTAIPVLYIAQFLLLLRLGDAKSTFEEYKNAITLVNPVATEGLAKALNFHPAAIFYRATAIRKDTDRLDEFIRCAGLTREACLAYQITQLPVRKHFENAVHDWNSTPLEINLPKLKQDCPRVYTYIEDQLGSPLRKPFQLTAGTMMPLVTYAAEHDANIKSIAEIFRTTSDLAGLRNTYAHTLQEARKDDITKAKSLFKKLQNVVPTQEHQSLRDCDPFSICTEIVVDLLRYSDR
jgi:hypothetical protein